MRRLREQRIIRWGRGEEDEYSFYKTARKDKESKPMKVLLLSKRSKFIYLFNKTSFE